MRFKIGKPREKPEKDDAEVESNVVVEQISEMEEKINGRTKNLEKKAKELQGLAVENGATEDDEETLIKPHGPLAELTIEPGDERDEADSLDAEEDLFEEGGEEVKVVEVSGESPAPPKDEKEAKPEETKEEAKPEESDDSINKLFSEEEEEENPLANLIKSLPDVTATELIDDLNEIKGIIKDWQQS
jgi:hypothetical protein